MKTPSSNRLRRQSGFTLIELLVVIAIIAVLAAAGFAVGGKAINKARTVTSVAAAQAIEMAVNQYYTDYTSLPDVGDKVVIDGGEGARLANILAGLDTGSQNPKKTKYLSINEGKGKRNGAIYTDGGDSIVGIYDPWGNPYTVFLDQDYEERLVVKVGNKSKTLNGKRVAVASPGPDKEWGTSDDIQTWAK